MAMFQSKKQTASSKEVEANNIIGKGTKIIGDLITEGNIRIDGEINGNITSKSKVALGGGSNLKGNLVSSNAEVEGEVTGNLFIAELLILKANAVINGDVSALRMLTEPGAKINGQCKVGEAPKATTSLSNTALNGNSGLNGKNNERQLETSK
ncbi:Integral membrane protein CcmA involved in cell shape determination [Bernardetia litoralis DSM 6794]|uniref:Integral membrane protein CcmA involved in cell shape determination n=2 Tax=Bernardetia litoralis TaxID=999 RepID=I4AGF4_BERLS|nr:Integral membrane protein CcmA involved in cell shape determination [Bernardetia litoralis DSM 6794]